MSAPLIDLTFTFMETFVRAEHDAFRAWLQARTAAAANLQNQRMRDYFAFDIDLFGGWPSKPTHSWFAIGEQLLANDSSMPRVLFQIKTYRLKSEEIICRVYASNRIKPIGNRLGYAVNYFVSTTNNGLKIVAWYDLDPDGESEHGFADNGLSWAYRGGLSIEHLAAPMAIKKITSPQFPEERAEFDAE